MAIMQIRPDYTNSLAMRAGNLGIINNTRIKHKSFFFIFYTPFAKSK